IMQIVHIKVEGVPLRGFGNGAFDPQTLVLLEAAFDEAWLTLKSVGNKTVKPDELARAVLRLAMEGERDPIQLHDGALEGLLSAAAWREASCSWRHGTRLRAHAPNPTMHRTSTANTATFNTASIMLPSTESRLPLKVLICRRPGKFPAIDASLNVRFWHKADITSVVIHVRYWG